MQKPTKNSTVSSLWNAWCFASLIGIWPRFIEPRLLQTTHLSLPINIPPALDQLKILQFSDLHLHRGVSDRFLKKLEKRIMRLKPDIIVFTGDFLCYSELDDRKRLKDFLCCLNAPYGCFAILGNHDYSEFVSINEKGDYDVIKQESSSLMRAFKRLFAKTTITGKITPRAKAVTMHEELLKLLELTPFKVLHNETKILDIKGHHLNICGLGEYFTGRFHPDEAFKNYNPKYPGIVLSHNPDTAPRLLSYPGDIILSGHAHGKQVNLPWIWKRFTLMENRNLTRGLKKIDGKWLYINRGVGGVIDFRWFAIPEILLLRLTQ